MTSDIARPTIVLAAAALFAASVALNIGAELTFTFTSLAAGVKVGVLVGRLVWPLLWLAVQAALLFKLMQGRNWARISLIALAVLTVSVRYLALNSHFARLLDVTIVFVAGAQTVLEVVAVLLVLMAGSYFSRRASA